MRETRRWGAQRIANYLLRKRIKLSGMTVWRVLKSIRSKLLWNVARNLFLLPADFFHRQHPDNHIPPPLFIAAGKTCLTAIRDARHSNPLFQRETDRREGCRHGRPRVEVQGQHDTCGGIVGCIIRKTKCFDFWERNVLFPKTKRSFFRTPTPLPCPFPLNFSLLIITKKFGNLAKNRYICIV